LLVGELVDEQVCCLNVTHAEGKGRQKPMHMNPIHGTYLNAYA